jgi:hypothetical protein
MPRSKPFQLINTLIVTALVVSACRSAPPTPTIIPPTPTISPREVSERLVDQVDSSFLYSSSFAISPDNQRVAAIRAENGDKQSVVVDDNEGKHYDSVGQPVFSPNSQRVAYTAREGDKYFVVVNGNEGKSYDDIIQGRITFDSANNFHYLARQGNAIYLVEEKIETAVP